MKKKLYRFTALFLLLMFVAAPVSGAMGSDFNSKMDKVKQDYEKQINEAKDAYDKQLKEAEARKRSLRNPKRSQRS